MKTREKNNHKAGGTAQGGSAWPATLISLSISTASLFLLSCAANQITYQPSIVSTSPTAVSISARDDEAMGEPLYSMAETNAFTKCEEIAARAEMEIKAQMEDDEEVASLAWYDDKSKQWVEVVSCRTEFGIAHADASALSYIPMKRAVTARAFIFKTPAEPPAPNKQTSAPVP